MQGEIERTVTASISAEGTDVILKNAINDEWKRAGWAWYEQHKDDVLIEKKVFIFPVKIRVKDLRFLFERLFGSQPTTTL